MKVIHLVTYKRGGAANAAFRINNALIKAGVESQVLTKEDILLTNHLLKRLWFKIKKKLCDRLIAQHAVCYYTDDLMGQRLSNLSEIKNADIIHFHWVSEGLIDLKGLKALLKLGKPVVWTLHDMHPFTGGCHYNGHCEKYKHSCGACPALQSEKKYDFSSYNQKKKIEIISKYGKNMLIVGCSQWMARCAAESRIMRELKCISIPNCLDVNIFKPIDKEFAKNLLNIHTDKKLILFGAINSTADQRKGFEHLKKALTQLSPSEYEIAVFGGKTDEFSNYKCYNLGNFFDALSLCLVYNIADVFVAPSKQENLANTVMESLSCGTPVAAFNIGGMSDMILHQENGFLASPYDEKELALGIEFCCAQIKNADEIQQDIQRRFGESIIANRYIEEYKRLLADYIIE